MKMHTTPSQSAKTPVAYIVGRQPYSRMRRTRHSSTRKVFPKVTNNFEMSSTRHNYATRYLLVHHGFNRRLLGLKDHLGVQWLGLLRKLDRHFLWKKRLKSSTIVIKF